MDVSPFQEWLYYILILVYVITITGTIIVIISENRNPLKSIAWIVVLLFFPAGGLVFYFFLGRDFRKQRMISRKSLMKITQYTRHLKLRSRISRLKGASEQEIKLLYNLSRSNLYDGNRLTTYTGGQSMFDCLISDISNAQNFIHLEFYIFQDDDLGMRIKQILMEKVSQGVEVRVIYDDVGCWDVNKDFFSEMSEAGIEVKAFFEVRFAALANKINYRNHRKIVVIDGYKGYIGGMNIANRYVEGLEWGIWRDTHIRVEGPAVHGLQSAFSVDWYFSDRKLLWDARYFPEVPVVGDVSLQILTSGPIGQWKEILLGIFKMIANAKDYVYIQTPYFLPTEGLMMALQTAALARVDVRLMLPARADSFFIQFGGYSYIQNMLDAGVKVYLYTPGFLHSKAVIVDDELYTVGSTNMDFRSFEHNFEANAFVYDSKSTIEMKNIFLHDQKDCRRVQPREWRNRPRKQRILESVVRLFSPLL